MFSPLSTIVKEKKWGLHFLNLYVGIIKVCPNEKPEKE